MTDVLEPTNTLTFNYAMVAAPGEGDYVFTTMSSIAPGATALPVANPPSVRVREPITALDIGVDTDSVFVGEPIEVTVKLKDQHTMTDD